MSLRRCREGKRKEEPSNYGGMGKYVLSLPGNLQDMVAKEKAQAVSHFFLFSNSVAVKSDDLESQRGERLHSTKVTAEKEKETSWKKRIQRT